MRSRRAATAAMLGLGVFAFVWALARAWVQDVTGDEGENYVVFVAPHSDVIWRFSPTNHLLYTLLMRVSTGVFGAGPLAVRAPALLGTALYIAAAFWLCGLIARRWEVRVPLFVCLVFNPFVFDYFVAARGYGLASAFLLLALALHAWAHAQAEDRRHRVLLRVSPVAAVILVLSLAANFSFAFVDVAVGAGLLTWAVNESRRSRWRLVAWTIGPAALAFIALPGWTLMHAERGGFFFGANSLSEMRRSLTFSSLFELNSEAVNPWLFGALNVVKPYMIRAAMLAALATLLACLWRGVRDPRRRYLLSLLSVAGGAVIASVAVHLAAHRAIGLPLPLERTALYVVVIFTLCAGILASLPVKWRPGRIIQWGLIAVMFTFAFDDLACLRLTYFCEWAYQRDVKRAFWTAAWYANQRDLKDIEVSWYYYGALSYYRLATSQSDNIPPFASGNPHTSSRQLYVLNGPLERDFIERQSLKVVWKSDVSDVVVAVR